MFLPSPADELAQVRNEIERLRAREAILRKMILQDPDQNSIGRWHRFEIEERRDVSFDANLLPMHIRQDPAYLRETLVQTLHCLPAQNPIGRRPGWPIRREVAVTMH